MTIVLNRRVYIAGMTRPAPPPGEVAEFVTADDAPEVEALIASSALDSNPCRERRGSTQTRVDHDRSVEDAVTEPIRPIIQICDLSKKYDAGRPALDGLNLDVEAGEALAVLGPSGSGKSTLLNMIAGLDKPTEGSVTVDALRVDELSEAASAKYRRQRIGLIFQFFNLLDDLTVEDNVLLPAQLAGMPRGEANHRAAELLRHLGIARHVRSFPGRLSGGERQRVAVARALMNRPALLLADEPTGALDTASAADVRDLLAELNQDGQTIVLVTHDTALADSCATRTIELVDGKIARDVLAAGR